MRLAPLLVFLALALFLGFILLTQSERPAMQPESTAPTALPSLTLKPLKGNGVWNQSSLVGHVTVINFFASWCAPCAAEMPELVALKKQFPQVQVMGVAWNDEPKPIEASLKKSGNPFDSIWLDPTGDATIALGIKGIPESFLIDAQGNVRLRVPGPITQDLLEGKLGALIATLQAEAAHAP